MATPESDPNQTRLIVFSQFFKLKGMTMRIITASVIVAALSLGTPAFVQAQGAPSQPQGAPSQPEAQTPPAQSSTVIRSIQVVDIKDLKPSVRSKVDDIVAHTTD